MDFFYKLAKVIKSRCKNLISELKAYFKRLLFPPYLSPVKILILIISMDIIDLENINKIQLLKIKEMVYIAHD